MRFVPRLGSDVRRGPIPRVVLPLALALSGCMAVTSVDGPAGAPLPEAGMGCDRAEAFAFAGETTLAALGLGEFVGGGPDAQRRGTVWVTADAVEVFGPGEFVGPGPIPEPQRMVCVQWPDGSGLGGPLPEGWELPPAIDAAAEPDAAGPPVALIGLLAAAALIVAVSFLAFRGDRAPS